MSNILFLAASVSDDAAMTADKPILRGNLKSVSACHIRLGEVRENLIHTNRWVLTDEDDLDVVSEMYAVLCDWTLNMPVPPVIFAFNSLHVIRRLAGYAVQHHCRFLPASWWCGTGSRVFDICRYLSAGEAVTPAELLRNAGVECRDNYVPHADTRLDLKYLVELAEKYNIINLNLSDGFSDVLITDPVPVSAAAVNEAKPPKTVRRVRKLK